MHTHMHNDVYTSPGAMYLCTYVCVLYGCQNIIVYQFQLKHHFVLWPGTTQVDMEYEHQITYVAVAA